MLITKNVLSSYVFKYPDITDDLPGVTLFLAARFYSLRGCNIIFNNMKLLVYSLTLTIVNQFQIITVL